jgi:hypothetical protein
MNTPFQTLFALAPGMRRCFSALVSLSALQTLSPSAWAHEGHGLDGTHWHASDALMLILMTAVALGLLAWWRSRR